MSLRSIACAVVVMALAAAPASAQDARELFLEGRSAYDAGDYDAAVAAWTQAYELDARPLLQFNLAQAYERLGRLSEAVTAYRLFLDGTEPDAADVPMARARIAQLEQRLGNTAIVLVGGPEGAAIFIDGQDRGRLPRPDPIRVEPGSHRVEIRATGYATFSSTVAVSAGQQAEVAVEMTETSGGGGPVRDTTERSGGISPIGLAVAGGGAALLIVGGVTGGLALGAANGAESSEGSDADRARTLALVSDITLIAGGVAAVTGVVLMFVLGKKTDRATAVAPVVGPGLVGIGAHGRF